MSRKERGLLDVFRRAVRVFEELSIVRRLSAQFAPRTSSGEQRLRYVSVQPAFRRFVDTLPPPAAADVPSMISIAEKRLLFGLAERYCRGDGVIIDAGVFLGASTRCFGEGLRRNKRLSKVRALRTRPIISFEKGDLTPTMGAFLDTHYAGLRETVGDHFIHETRKNIADVEDLVDLHVGDILQDPLAIDCPIEICFLDILKSPFISLHCFKSFVPLLIPGRSIVLHQDYFYEKLPYIKTHQEFLGEHFDFLGEVGSTAIFRLTSPVPAEKLAGLSRIGGEEQLALADQAVKRSRDPYRRLMMSISRLRLVARFRGREEAQRQLETVKAEYQEQIARAPPRIVEALSDIEEICRNRE